MAPENSSSSRAQRRGLTTSLFTSFDNSVVLEHFLLRYHVLKLFENTQFNVH